MELKQFKDIEDLVFQVLRDQPETRDDSRKLCLAVWERQGLKLDEKQKYFFLKSYNSESITRAARFWQNDKCLFKPVNEQRDLFMQEQYKDHYSK